MTCGGWVLQKVDINLLVLLEPFKYLELPLTFQIGYGEHCKPLGLFQILAILVLDYRCP